MVLLFIALYVLFGYIAYSVYTAFTIEETEFKKRDGDDSENVVKMSIVFFWPLVLLFYVLKYLIKIIDKIFSALSYFPRKAIRYAIGRKLLKMRPEYGDYWINKAKWAYNAVKKFGSEDNISGNKILGITSHTSGHDFNKISVKKERSGFDFYDDISLIEDKSGKFSYCHLNFGFQRLGSTDIDAVNDAIEQSIREEINYFK